MKHARQDVWRRAKWRTCNRSPILVAVWVLWLICASSCENALFALSSPSSIASSCSCKHDEIITIMHGWHKGDCKNKQRSNEHEMRSALLG